MYQHYYWKILLLVNLKCFVVLGLFGFVGFGLGVFCVCFTSVCF